MRWWKWFFSAPKSINPAVDPSGKYSYLYQPQENLWFLAAKLSSRNKLVPRRFCRIPFPRSILFPVINCEVNSLECPELATHRDLIDYVLTDENTIVLKECYVDGKYVPVQRVKSDPEVFKAKIHTDNPFGAKHGGITPVAADGY